MVIDVHAHAMLPGVEAILAGTAAGLLGLVSPLDGR